MMRVSFTLVAVNRASAPIAAVMRSMERLGAVTAGFRAPSAAA